MYRITIELQHVSEGDATDVAQDIWNQHAEGFDAAQGDFTIAISRDGFPVDWVPEGV